MNENISRVDQAKESNHSINQENSRVIRDFIFKQGDYDKAKNFFQDIFDLTISRLDQEPGNNHATQFAETTINLIDYWTRILARSRKSNTDIEQDLLEKRSKLVAATNNVILESFGPETVFIWNSLVESYPALASLRLSSVEPTEDDYFTATGGYFKDPDNHCFEVFIEIIAGKNNLEHYQQLLHSRKTSVSSMANLLEISPEKVTPELLRLFIFLHEVGHALDYLTNFNTPRGYRRWSRRNQSQMNTLPIPGLGPTELSLALNKNPEFSSLEFTEKAMIMERQENAYRALPKEQFADEFAANHIKFCLGQQIKS